jgi:hypothetical protein
MTATTHISRLNKVGDAIDKMQMVRLHVARTLPEMGQEWADETLAFHEAATRAAIDEYMASSTIDDADAREAVEQNLLGRAGLPLEG